MKQIIATAITLTFASVAHADSEGFSNVSGSFGGGVSTFAKSGGFSATGSFGGDTTTSIRNESGSGEFAGASVEWSSDVDGGSGDATMQAESFTDGFDFSRTFAGGGVGGSFAARGGMASAGGSFGGEFGNEFGDDDFDFPGLGLGHGGFDDKPGEDDDYEDDD